MSPLATIGMRFQGDHAVFFAWGSRAGVFAREVAGTAVRQRTTRAALVAVVVDSVNWLNRPTSARFGGVDRPHAIPFCKNAAGPAAGQERASAVETLRDLRPFRSPGWSLVLDCPQKYPVRRQSASALEPTGALRCRSLARPDWYECLEREPVLGDRTRSQRKSSQSMHGRVLALALEISIRESAVLREGRARRESVQTRRLSP